MLKQQVLFSILRFVVFSIEFESQCPLPRFQIVHDVIVMNLYN